MRFCVNCGREISEHVQICPFCGGSNLPGRPMTPAPVAAPAAAPAPAPAPAPNAPPVGAPAAAPAPQWNAPNRGYVPPQPGPTYVQPQVNVVTAAPITAANLPEQYRPLSPWAYFGLSLLYTVPIVGFVFFIIFTFSKGNINRRNFTRSYWIPLIITLIVGAIVVGIVLATGASLEIGDFFSNIFDIFK